MKRLNLKIHGKVQGVFFRDSTQKKAEELGLVGSVKNSPDGTVELCAEGEEETLNRFVEFCKDGPEWARVDKIEEGWEDIEGAGFEGFEIEF